MQTTKRKEKASANPIVFKKNYKIGFADAESDTEFLNKCFYETDDVSALLDCSNPQRVIVGRTGSGKTALLKQLHKDAEKSTFITPDQFSFRYLSDSTILRFFEDIGVNLNTFYLLLWRHIFAIELIKLKYDVSTEEKRKNFIGIIANKAFGNPSKKKALEYLEKWGEKFWENTETRIKELTTKLEKELTAAASASPHPGISIGVDSASKLSKEQKEDLIERGKSVVSQIQIKDLQDIIRLLAEDIFDDDQEKHYIFIDCLDESWIDEAQRYKVIRALLDTLKKFQTISNTKVVVTLRTDILERVTRETRDIGFQSEKYESLFLRLMWNKNDIEKILEKRVNQLFKRQYNNDSISIRDIMPKPQKNQQDAIGYILDRTFLRPREAIEFINLCIQHADGKSTLSMTIIQQAEQSYSQKRLLSLKDEWSADYPLLDVYSRILNGRKKSFPIKDLIKCNDTEEILLEARCFDEEECNRDLICTISKEYIDKNKQPIDRVIKEILLVFYNIGLIGLKISHSQHLQWSHMSELSPNIGQLNGDVDIYIHPTFWMTLGIRFK